MIMGLAESENIIERIENAKVQLNNRKQILNEHKSAINGLENLFEQTQQLITILGAKWEQVRRGAGNFF